MCKKELYVANLHSGCDTDKKPVADGRRSKKTFVDKIINPGDLVDKQHKHLFCNTTRRDASSSLRDYYNCKIFVESISHEGYIDGENYEDITTKSSVGEIKTYQIKVSASKTAFGKNILKTLSIAKNVCVYYIVCYNGDEKEAYDEILRNWDSASGEDKYEKFVSLVRANDQVHEDFINLVNDKERAIMCLNKFHPKIGPNLEELIDQINTMIS